MSDVPKLEKVKARDVVPYEWALWCSFREGEPFANDVVHVRWSEDGTQLVFGLESHNSMFVHPDDELELIRIERAYVPPGTREKHAETIARGPQMKDCPRCKGRGKVST